MFSLVVIVTIGILVAAVSLMLGSNAGGRWLVPSTIVLGIFGALLGGLLTATFGEAPRDISAVLGAIAFIAAGRTLFKHRHVRV